MKKALIILAALLVAALAGVSATDWLLPDPGQFSAAAEGEGGITYVVENGPIFSQIYGVTEEGALRSLYRESSAWGSRSITQLTWSDGALSFLRETDTASGTHWEVVRLDADNQPVVQGQLSASGYRATGLTAPAYVTGVSADGSGGAAVYDLTDGSAVLIQSAPQEGLILSARYQSGSGALLALLDSGQTVEIGSTGTYQSDAVLYVQPPQSVSLTFGQRLACKAPALLLAVCVVLVVGLLATLVVLLCARAKRLAVRVTAVSTGCLFLALCLMAGLLLHQTTSTRLRDRLLETQRSARQTAATLSTLSPSQILDGSFRGSEGQALYASLLTAGAEGELYALSGSEPTVAVSP